MATIPNVQAGVPYSFQLTASGGVPPLTWAIVSGSFPSGITLSSSGLISGTTVQGGTFPFTIRATDALGRVVNITCSFMTLPEACSAEDTAPIVIITNMSDPGGDIDWTYDDTEGAFYINYGNDSNGRATVEKRSLITGSVIGSCNVAKLFSTGSDGADGIAIDSTYVYLHIVSRSAFADTRVVMRVVRINRSTMVEAGSVTIMDVFPTSILGDYFTRGLLIQGDYLYAKGSRSAGGPTFSDGYISQIHLPTFTITNTRYFLQSQNTALAGTWEADATHIYLHHQVQGSATNTIVKKINPADFMGAIPEVALTFVNSYYGPLAILSPTKVYAMFSGDPVNQVAVIDKAAFTVDTQVSFPAGGGGKLWGSAYKDGYIYICNNTSGGPLGGMALKRILAADLTTVENYGCGGVAAVPLDSGGRYTPRFALDGRMYLRLNTGGDHRYYKRVIEFS